MDHEWRKVWWSVQYWVVHWGNMLCAFDNFRLCWCHIFFNGKDLVSPSGPFRWIFRSPSRFIGRLGRPGDLLFYTLSMKLLDGFTPFKGSWTCLDLKLCNIIVICPFAPYRLAHGPKICQIGQHLGQTLRNPYLWNRCMDLYHLKFYGIV